MSCSAVPKKKKLYSISSINVLSLCVEEYLLYANVFKLGHKRDKTQYALVRIVGS